MCQIKFLETLSNAEGLVVPFPEMLAHDSLVIGLFAGREKGKPHLYHKKKWGFPFCRMAVILSPLTEYRPVECPKTATMPVAHS